MLSLILAASLSGVSLSLICLVIGLILFALAALLNMLPRSTKDDAPNMADAHSVLLPQFFEGEFFAVSASSDFSHFGLGKLALAVRFAFSSLSRLSVRAISMSARHRRERLFVLAYSQQNGLTRITDQSKTEDATLGRRELCVLQGWPQGSIQLGHGSQNANAERTTWSAEPSVGRMAHGIPNRVERVECLGNAVVPQIAEWIGMQIVKSSLN